jgi:predicted dehydrogenase
VAHVRRFYPSSQSIKLLIQKKTPGNVVSVDCKEGLVFNWPTASGFFFDRDKAGGGVLMDIGVHLLDLLMWWFDSEPTLLEYEDDNLGGVEAFSKMKLKFDNEVEGTVTISRLSQLRNTYRIQCEKGIIEYNPFDMAKYFIYDSVKETHRKTIKTAKRKFSFMDAVKAMLEDFCTAIREGGQPKIAGQEGIKTIEFIQECYQNKKQIDTPWL